MSESEVNFPWVHALCADFSREYDYDLRAPMLVALSGGADSVALLLALREAGIAVGAAHLDHGTREGGSAADAQWVETFCASLGIPCFSKQVNVPALAEASEQSFEEVARGVRYDFLAETAQAEGYTAIATGHHADDQAETALMRVLRGTSPKGLGGIPGVGAWKGVAVVRPLLHVTRDAIEAYVRGQGVAYRDDHTNNDPQYVRNRVRHSLMPLLRESFNPQVGVALRRMATVARDEDAVMQALCDEAYAVLVAGQEICRIQFGAVSRAIQRRVLVRLAHEAGAIADFDAIEGALEFVVKGATGHHYDWGRGVQLSNGREVTLVVQDSVTAAASVEISVPGRVEAFGKIWDITLLDALPEEPLANYCNATRQVVDATALGNRVVLRQREAGDRFQPFGMDGTRKVKDYLNDCGLPLEQRDALVLVTNGDAIVWVAGHAMAQPFVVTEGTQSFVHIEVMPT